MSHETGEALLVDTAKTIHDFLVDQKIPKAAALAAMLFIVEDTLCDNDQFKKDLLDKLPFKAVCSLAVQTMDKLHNNK